MRTSTRHPEGQERLILRDERKRELAGWLTNELEDALSSRTAQDASWRDLLRMYEAVPKHPQRNSPIENAPNLEVPLGAIAADSIYAQSVDLVYNISPILSARAIGDKYVKHAKALQRFVNWSIAAESQLRAASEQAFLDNVQLGTGVYYIPYVETTKKTKVHRITSQGPRVYSVPPEDFLVPGGAVDDLQAIPWCSMRTWLTRQELVERAKLHGWNIDGIAPAGNVSWVRSRRESLGRTGGVIARKSDLYEVHHLYCAYDLDDDGIAEDLLIDFDRTSRTILKARFNPYDVRPFEAMRYQLRPHLFYGLGVLEMLRPFQEEATELHVQRTLNTILANARLWVAREGAVPDTMKIWPNKVIAVDDIDRAIKEIALADVYPSSAQAESITLSLAERRVGINDLSAPRPSAVLGSRTPGITALSMLQQSSRRFTPAFDGMRLATAGAVRQTLYRYQERLLAADYEVEAHLMQVMGPEDGRLLVAVLRDPDFDNAMTVELTASSASINRDADRQNALMLANLLATYYTRMLQLVGMVAQPGVPPSIKTAAEKIASASTELMDRTIRTFEQVRDPATFLINVEEELGASGGPMDQGAANGLGGMGQLLARLAGAAGAGAPGNGAGALVGGVPGAPGDEGGV